MLYFRSKGCLTFWSIFTSDATIKDAGEHRSKKMRPNFYTNLSKMTHFLHQRGRLFCSLTGIARGILARLVMCMMRCALQCAKLMSSV